MTETDPSFQFLGARVVEEVYEERHFLEATVKILVAGEVTITAGSGQDQVGAVLDALKKALLPSLPAVADLQVTSWKMRYGGLVARGVLHCSYKDRKWFTAHTGPTMLSAIHACLQDAVEHVRVLDQASRERELVAS